MKTKVLVLISPSPSSDKNIRVAARMAEAYHCKFSAMYVERNGELSDVAAANLARHMQLVGALGGNLVVKYGEDVVETVADYVKLAGVTNLVLGKTWQSVGKKVGLEDKFILRLRDVEIMIVPDGQHQYYRENKIKKIADELFATKGLIHKYKLANKTLDLVNLISQAAMEDNSKKAIAEVLSVAFQRSCVIFDGDRVSSPYKGEDLSFFDSDYERAVAVWCKKNGKTAGRGTDTLRESKAIYFPVCTAQDVEVVAFSCRDSKLSVADRMMLFQIESVLKVILSGR